MMMMSMMMMMMMMMSQIAELIRREDSLTPFDHNPRMEL
jgi:hypothetical protein